MAGEGLGLVDASPSLSPTSINQRILAIPRNFLTKLFNRGIVPYMGNRYGLDTLGVY